MHDAVYDAIVIGSGAAGTFAAHGLAGKRILVLDVGKQPPPFSGLDGNFYDLRMANTDLFAAMIGDDFEGMRNLASPPVSLKLKSPLLSYIIDDWERLSPVVTRNFAATMSFAAGGLANAWGAGAYRFDADDLAAFPLTPAELAPYYDEVSAHVGISGENDDLSRYFGEDSRLMPAVRPARFAAAMLERYRAERPWFQRQDLHLGKPRLAILTRPHAGRQPYRYQNLEFFRPHIDSIYNPVYTLRQMLAAGQITYQGGHLARSFKEMDGHIAVKCRDLAAEREVSFRARRLVLAAGTLNSTKIVLRSADEHQSRLPILDNASAWLPLFWPGGFGAALDRHDSAIGQLNIIYDPPRPGERVQGTLLGTTGPMRTDVLCDLPLGILDNRRLAKYLAPALALLIVFYPDAPHSGNYLRLGDDDGLEIVCGAPRRRPIVEALMLKAMRRLGFYGHPALCRYSGYGSGLHYAGCLPMRLRPGPFETAPDGRLHGHSRVFVADAAGFPALPAKNLTLTIMANALRIGRLVAKELD